MVDACAARSSGGEGAGQPAQALGPAEAFFRRHSLEKCKGRVEVESVRDDSGGLVTAFPHLVA